MKKTRRIIDLSMLIHEGMQTFGAPWHSYVEITQLGRHGIENRETRKIVMGTHVGSHIDAPRHFIPGGATVESIPLDAMVGPASLLDFSSLPPRTEVGVEDLKRKLGSRSAERLLIRFDGDKWLGTSKYYSEHPYFSEDACRWMVDRGCRMLALDTPQPDDPRNGRTGPKDAPNHKILLGASIVIVEYLVNLRELKQDVVDLVVAPIKLKDGDGAPARCFAMIDDEG